MCYNFGASSSAFYFRRIIWLGDLNYRIALSYRSVKALVEMRNWKALLEKDQVRVCKPS
ncbi:Os03g0160600 [Oryza sativa Japonica Group]|uniref:Os03g0160600 protein n=1 Tax=Oryza sativa subsp. japonica TaxID=39947 RepID=Q0DUY6_ORYSJ|nr:Os03g0160600 [Oryza sativa Japonica Group]|eukprot:NP_001049038.2 Os03g0160600 [Oryza sativa Japonica Group]